VDALRGHCDALSGALVALLCAFVALLCAFVALRSACVALDAGGAADAGYGVDDDRTRSGAGQRAAATETGRRRESHRGYDAAMSARAMILLGVSLAVGCGGSSATTSPKADSGADSGAGTPTCQPTGLIPDAAVYTCEAGPAGSAGCRATVVDPSDHNLYREGCMVTLPMPSGFAPCSPLQCTCQRTPGFDDGGLEFICPD
jgi:hypothetical protein